MAQGKWVTNDEADKVVLAVQEALATGKLQKDIPEIRKLIDLVSGVDGYSHKNHHHQKLIKSIFNSEKLYNNNTACTNTVVDLNEAVSEFWEAVFKNLSKAKTVNSVVNVRKITDEETTEKKQGLEYVARKTNCNPIYYLRNQGIMAVRNLLNKQYRRMLIRICSECGNGGSISNIETDLQCNKCKSISTEKWWPDGNSTYKSKKFRKCNNCSTTWERKFKHVCSNCQSTDIRLEYKFIDNDNVYVSICSDEVNADMSLIEHQSESAMATLISKVINSFPKLNDVNNSKTAEVFAIMVIPETSHDMCKQCNDTASMVCQQKCGKHECEHDLIPDPDNCCGSDHFVMGKCVNFSRKIAQYHKCSASLAARRVQKARQYFIKYIRNNINSDECASILDEFTHLKLDMHN